MRSAAAQVAAARFGHQAAAGAVRLELAELRRNGLAIAADDAAALALARLEAADAPRLKPVYNLTGTVCCTPIWAAPWWRRPQSRRLLPPTPPPPPPPTTLPPPPPP